MLKFININTGETVDHLYFVCMVWHKAEEKYEEWTGNLWCNLNAYEQNEYYCIQFEELVNEGWMMFPSKWRFK